MAIQPEGLGAIGIVAAWLVREAIPRIQKRRNGNGCKPGKAKECVKHELELKEHDTTIKHLYKLIDDNGKQAEVARKENREDHQRIFDKLDELK